MAAIPFGEFELHEAARALQHRGEAVPVQRLVLALFGYLVRNAGRTVPKDELLDALWPGVHVTERRCGGRRASRGTALKASGTDDALRSIPRLGYRFALDRPVLDVLPLNRCVPRLAAARQCAGGSRDARLERSRGALRRDRPRRAGSARRISASGPVRSPARPAAEPPARSTSGRSRAVSLGLVEVELGHGDAARVWIDRAEELLGADGPPQVLAFTLWLKSRIVSTEGDQDEALALAGRAVALAAAASTSMRALVLVHEDLYRMALGDVAAAPARTAWPRPASPARSTR